jgi:hypothetical protein
MRKLRPAIQQALGRLSPQIVVSEDFDCATRRRVWNLSCGQMIHFTVDDLTLINLSHHQVDTWHSFFSSLPSALSPQSKASASGAATP